MSLATKIVFPFCLASQSPRRRQILDSLGFSYEVIPPTTTDEKSATVANAVEICQENALAKAQSVFSEGSNKIYIGADTLVLSGDTVLGKPRDKDHAHFMLRRLSSATHAVVTGMALVSSRGTRSASCKSFVTFRKLNEEDLTQYLSTREPYDKAGAYAVQGMGSIFISRIDGSYTNVMGLPIETFLEELSALTQTHISDWFR